MKHRYFVKLMSVVTVKTIRKPRSLSAKHQQFSIGWDLIIALFGELGKESRPPTQAMIEGLKIIMNFPNPDAASNLDQPAAHFYRPC